MKIDPAKFFITKIAKDDSEKPYDPGPAIASVLATASGRTAQTLLPIATTLGLEHLIGTDPKDWMSVSQYGLKKFDLGEITKNIHSEKLKRPLLDLIGLRRLPRTTDVQGVASPFRPEDLENFQKIAPSVNKMIDKYDLSKKGVRLNIGAGTLGKFFGPEYESATKVVKLPGLAKEHVLHELGHAAHLTKPGARMVDMIRTLADKGIMYALPLSYIAGNEIKKMIPGTIDDKAITFIQDHAPAIAASSILAADVYPEVQATARAVHHVYKTEGSKAAKQSLKRLLPGMASYVVPIIPFTVGLAIARKYFREGQKETEKTASVSSTIKEIWKIPTKFMDEIWKDTLMPLGMEAGFTTKQLGEEFMGLWEKENIGNVANSFWEASKKTVKSPVFIEGAILGGIPAAALSYVSYNTPHGKTFAERKRQIISQQSPIDKAVQDVKRLEEKQKIGEPMVPIMAGIGAALSGGFLNKFFDDLGAIL